MKWVKGVLNAFLQKGKLPVCLKVSKKTAVGEKKSSLNTIVLNNFQSITYIPFLRAVGGFSTLKVSGWDGLSRSIVPNLESQHALELQLQKSWLPQLVMKASGNLLGTTNLDAFKPGFRPATEKWVALVALIDDLHQDLDKRSVSLLVLPNLLAAFNIINHRILLNHLSWMGLGDTVLQWLWSFLKERTQKVVLGGSCLMSF